MIYLDPDQTYLHPQTKTGKHRLPRIGVELDRQSLGTKREIGHLASLFNFKNKRGRLKQRSGRWTPGRVNIVHGGGLPVDLDPSTVCTHEVYCILYSFNSKTIMTEMNEHINAAFRRLIKVLVLFGELLYNVDCALELGFLVVRGLDKGFSASASRWTTILSNRNNK